MLALSTDTLAALAVFAFASSVTPGPNNAMLMASGATFGVRRTAPHMAGVVLGFAFMVLAVGLGLGGLFAAYPILYEILWVIGMIYLLYLAWKIANSATIGSAKAVRPMRFVEAVAFQWVNPKAWTGAIGAITAYAPKENYLAGLIAIVLVFLIVNSPTVLIWSGFGAVLRRFLERPGALRAFNVTMALALVASLIPSVIDHLQGWMGG